MIYSVLEKFLRPIFGFIPLIFYSRYFSAEVFSELNLLIAAYAIVNVIILFAGDSIAFVERSRNRNFVIDGILSQIIGGILLTLFVASAASILSPQWRYLFYGLPLLSYALMVVIQSLFHSDGRFRLSFLLTFTSHTLSFIIKLISLYLDMQPQIVLVIAFIDPIIYLITICIYATLQKIEWKQSIRLLSLSAIRAHHRQYWQLAAVSIITVVFMKADQLILSLKFEKNQLVFYLLSLRVYDMLNMLFAGILRPGIQYCISKSIQMRTIYLNAFFLSLASAFFITHISEGMISLVFGRELKDASIYLNIIIFALIFDTIGTVLHYDAQRNNLQRELLCRSLFATLVYLLTLIICTYFLELSLLTFSILFVVAHALSSFLSSLLFNGHRLIIKRVIYGHGK